MDLAGYKPTIGEVAALFGKSGRWISDLRAKGELPGDGATLGEFVAAWTSHATVSTGGKSIDQHKTRLAAAKADQAEMRSAQLRGELLPAGGVNRAVQGAFARVRSKLLGLPSKIAPRVASMKSEVAVEQAITELVHEALAELASTTVGGQEESAPGGSGDPPDGGGGAGGGGEKLVAGADAATAADGERMGGREPGAEPGRKRRTR